MGLKLILTGLTLVTASSILIFIPAVNIVGMVLMLIGTALLLFDR